VDETAYKLSFLNSVMPSFDKLPSGSSLEPEGSYTATGNKSHHYSRCDVKFDVTVIPPGGYNFGVYG
jgi:hypothetical protein